MTPFTLAPNLHLAALDPRMFLLPLLLGCGVYLVLSGMPFARPKPDLGERLRQLDVDERMRLAELSRHASRPLFSSRLLENMLRPIVEDVGRAIRGMLLRVGLAGGSELEDRLRIVRPGVDLVQFMGEKVAAGMIVAVIFPLRNLLRM